MYGTNKRSLHLQRRIFLAEATEWKSESGEPGIRKKKEKKHCEKSLCFISLSIRFIDTRSFCWSRGIPQEDVLWQFLGKFISSIQEEKR